MNRKISAIFRCPAQDCQEMETICANNNIDFSRYVLSALLMYTDECEAEGIIPNSKAAARKKAPGSGKSEKPERSADSGEAPGVPDV